MEMSEEDLRKLNECSLSDIKVHQTIGAPHAYRHDSLDQLRVALSGAINSFVALLDRPGANLPRGLAPHPTNRQGGRCRLQCGREAPVPGCCHG